MLSVDNIVKIFCSCSSINESDLQLNNNSYVNDTKYMLWLYLHCEMKLSAGQIGAIFHRNRPTIFRGIRLIKHHFKYYKEIRIRYDDILQKIGDATAAASPENMEEE